MSFAGRMSWRKAAVAALFAGYAVAYTSAFVSQCPASSKYSRFQTTTTIFKSDNNNHFLEDSESIAPGNNDPDGVPLFDTNERSTLFGLEPNAEFSDPIDNPGLQFTGPLIMFLSIYVTLSLFFAGDGEELVLFDNIQ